MHDASVESHPCVVTGCQNIVPYDDEPWCYTHSPDSGSSVSGYSYKGSRERRVWIESQ